MINTTDQDASSAKPEKLPCIQCKTPTIGRYWTANTKETLKDADARPLCQKCFQAFSAEHFEKLNK